MQDALGACPKPKKGFWATVLGIHKKYEEFKVGVAKGLWKGLKGTVTGIADLAVWAGKHSTPYMLLNPQGYAEQLQKDKETAKALGNLAKKGGKWAYRNSVVNMALNPNDYVAAQTENKVMMDKLIEKAKTMDAEDWGELTGQIGFEIILEVATVGAAAALTTLKVADKTVDAARALEKIDDFTDTAKGLKKIDDVGDGLKGLDELGDVVFNLEKKKEKPEWLKNLDEGNKFNKDRAEFYDYNEVYVKKPDGDGYYRLDSYKPGKEIVSRKHTQLSEIQDGTAKSYINEINKKYPEGTEIADVPSNVDGGNSGIFESGEKLRGDKILEVPVQDNPVPKSVIDAANDAGIQIRDVNGKVYNP